MSKPRRNTRDKILDASLSLAGNRSWSSISLSQISGEAGINPAQLSEFFCSRNGIVGALIQRVTAECLRELSPEDQMESSHEILFDTLMTRLDILSRNRDAYSSIIRSMYTHPCDALILLSELRRGMAWALEVAGLDSSGFKGRIRIEGLTAIYVSALGIWLSDTTDGSAKTMSFLDKSLKNAGRIEAFLPCGLSPRSDLSR